MYYNGMGIQQYGRAARVITVQPHVGGRWIRGEITVSGTVLHDNCPWVLESEALTGTGVKRSTFKTEQAAKEFAQAIRLQAYVIYYES